MRVLKTSGRNKFVAMWDSTCWPLPEPLLRKVLPKTSGLLQGTLRQDMEAPQCVVWTLGLASLALATFLLDTPHLLSPPL